MSACKYYDTGGYRCGKRLDHPCHECGSFAPCDDLPGFTANTLIGASSNPHVGSEFDAEEYYGSTVAKPTADTVIPDTPEDRLAKAVDMAREELGDAVHSPSHYRGHYPVEVREIIKVTLAMIVDEEPMTPWQIYCLGNELKYRLRAGLKGDAAEDIAKAMEYATFRKEG